MAKIAANSTATPSPPNSRNGRRLPRLARLASDSRPATGLNTTSHALGTSTIAPATAPGTAIVSVR